MVINGDKYDDDSPHQALIHEFFADVGHLPLQSHHCYRLVPFPLPGVGTSTNVVPALPFFKDDVLERPVELRPVPLATRRFLAPVPAIAMGSEAPTERESASEIVMIVVSESAPPRPSAILCFQASFERWSKHSAA